MVGFFVNTLVLLSDYRRPSERAAKYTQTSTVRQTRGGAYRAVDTRRSHIGKLISDVELNVCHTSIRHRFERHLLHTTHTRARAESHVAQRLGDRHRVIAGVDRIVRLENDSDEPTLNVEPSRNQKPVVHEGLQLENHSDRSTNIKGTNCSGRPTPGRVVESDEIVCICHHAVRSGDGT